MTGPHTAPGGGSPKCSAATICPIPIPDVDFSCLTGCSSKVYFPTSARLIVSIDSPNQVIDLQRVRNCLSQVCASQAEFDQFFSEVFEQLDGLSAQLLHRQQAWQTHREETEDDYRRRCQQLAQRRAETAAQQDELQQRADASTAAATAADDHRLQQALDQIEQQRGELTGVLEDAQKQVVELAHATSELVQTRNQFQELLTTAGTAGPAGVIEAVQQQLVQMQNERVELEQERASLEAELEAVRNRAAEMSENLAQQKREMAQERAEWAEEFKRLRCLLESLSQRQAVVLQETAGTPIAAPAHVPAATERPASDTDPVLDSVMAQFELLQRDMTRRRKQQAPNSG